MIHKIRGTQDFLDLTLFNFLITASGKHFARYHFSEIATPILESVELFKRTLGQETDVVSKEMFLVSSGQDDDAICLRPEATASTIRAFIENSITHMPWKVFSHGPMFRYERPQKGRFRQFHQINIEVIGTSAIAQDAQLLAMLDRFFQETLLLEGFALTINFLGCPSDREQFKKLLDQFLTPIQDSICATCRVRKEKNILRVFDCKNETCKTLYTKAPVITDHLCAPCNTEWQALQNYLQLLSVPYSCVPSLVRGLDYYDKTVFEFVSDQLGAQSTFCGGGRYNRLVSQLGGKVDQPSIGAAMGIERLLLLLEPIKDKLSLPQAPALHALLPMSKDQIALALLLEDELQAAGLCVETFLEEGSLKSMMRHANKMGARFALILGTQEQEKGLVTVKNMTTGHEEQVAQAEVVQYLKNS